MSTQISDLKSWKPANVAPVTGGLKLAGDATSSVVSILDNVVQIGAALVKASALLVPSTADPAVLALNASIVAAQKLLEGLSVLNGQYSVLLIPPVVGDSAKFVDYISTKLDDDTDPFRPAPATDSSIYHAGLLVFATLDTPNSAKDSYKAFADLFGIGGRKPSNALGFSTFRPSLKVSSVSGNPLLTWTYPHVLDLARGLITVRDADGNVYNSVKSVREVAVWRRKRDGDNITEDKLTQKAHNPFDTTYTDTTVTEGTYEYAVDFDYELKNGQFLGGVKSNWVKINLTKKAKKKAVGGGNYPRFMGVQAQYSIEGFDLVMSRIDQFLEQLKGRDTNFKNELDEFSSFISQYSTLLNSRVTSLVNHLKRVAANLDTLANSGLFFVAYEGDPKTCLTQISAKMGSGSSLNINVGMLMDASSSTQLLAGLAIDGIKKLCGWGGELRLVDTIGKQAQNIRKVGATIYQNVEQLGRTTADKVSSELSDLDKAKEALESVASKSQVTGISS